MAKGRLGRGLVALVLGVLLLLSSFALFQLLLIGARTVLANFGITSDTAVYTTIVVFTLSVFGLLGYSLRRTIKRLFRV